MKKKPKIMEKKIEAILPARHRGKNNFSRSNGGLLVEDKFVYIFERMTQPPLLSKPRPFEAVVVV